MRPHPEVFTTDEIARAAGVPRPAVQQLVDNGNLRSIPGSDFYDIDSAVAAGRLARQAAVDELARLPNAPEQRPERTVSAALSWLIHAVVLAGLIWSTGTASMTSASPRERLVFVAGLGPGGGGGGGGKAPQAPARKIARPLPRAAESFTPTPEPIPSRTLIAPVAQRVGEENPAAVDEDGAGPGTGPGVDDGSGGGAGGGPFRPGSGIEPPRLMREVKAEYTDDARRRGVTGAVVLEVVVSRTGMVGEVKVLRGLGFGLDQRAVSAVQGWQFMPARRFGQPVDVIVEVEVEFSLR
jgi:TonB family protein